VPGHDGMSSVPAIQHRQEVTLLPVLGTDDEMTSAFERRVQAIAKRAQDGDQAARDALYAAFEPKIRRFARNIRGRLWERDDVVQEAYLVFVGVVDRWPPATPFGRYFLAHFPWRLRDAVYRGIGRGIVPPRFDAVPYDAPGWQHTVADQGAPDAESRALIEALASSFESPYGDILRLHILDGFTLTETAGLLGVSRRSVTRYWHAILIRLQIGEFYHC